MKRYAYLCTRNPNSLKQDPNMSPASAPAVNPYVSVDCVILGFDGTQMKVLVVRQTSKDGSVTTGGYKLPGSLINMDEDLDDAARRVLGQLTGLDDVDMIQFHAFGSPERLANPADAVWLERFHNLETKLERIVTVAYIAVILIDEKHHRLASGYEPRWVPVDDVPPLAFDHNAIVEAAVRRIASEARLRPTLIFGLLPRKFTATQLRVTMENVLQTHLDMKNFHKKMSQMPYVVPLDEHETGVAHRAARFYRFDKRRV